MKKRPTALKCPVSQPGLFDDQVARIIDAECAKTLKRLTAIRIMFKIKGLTGSRPGAYCEVPPAGSPKA